MTEPLRFPGAACLRDEEPVRAFARGELPPDAAAELGAHVAGCPWCEEIVAFEELRPSLAPLSARRVPEDVLGGFVEEVVALADAAERRGEARRFAELSRAAAVLLGALAISALLSRSPGPTPIPLAPSGPPRLAAAPAIGAVPPPVLNVKTPVVQIMLAKGGSSDVVMLVLDGDEAL